MLDRVAYREQVKLESVAAARTKGYDAAGRFFYRLEVNFREAAAAAGGG